MRSFAPLAALALLSCGESAEQKAAGPAIECAIGGGEFARTCTVERTEGREGLTLTIRNERGGFRRILLPRDGSGARAADGAERAAVTVLPDRRAEVALGGDRYRLPAAMGPR
ncbi:MAG TPA: hypothetical protein VF552_02420 [Allosphingosinicella sp.]|jgi:hypothetical protein